MLFDHWETSYIGQEDMYFLGLTIPVVDEPLGTSSAKLWTSGTYLDYYWIIVHFVEFELFTFFLLCFISIWVKMIRPKK